MRGIDLHYSLPCVDSKNIGATGASGGGNQTMWLTSYGGKPVGIPEGATECGVITYQNDKPVRHQINCPQIELGYKNRQIAGNLNNSYGVNISEIFYFLNL
jgi:hypothetical protein